MSRVTIIIDGGDASDWIDIPRQLRHLHNQQENIMRTLDEVLVKVTEGRTVDESLITLFAEVKAQLAEVLSGTVIPPAVQTKIDAIFDAVEADNAAVSAAVTANTPVEPAPPE